MRLRTVLICALSLAFVNVISAEEDVSIKELETVAGNAVENTAENAVGETAENAVGETAENAVVNAEDAENAAFFTAAVVEYNPEYLNSSSEDTVKANLKHYQNIVQQLKKKTPAIRIIVFPEAGLHSLQGLRSKDLHAESVPDPKHHTIPYKQKKTTLLGPLSALAHKHNVYLVVNLVEEAKNKNKTEVKYNTNVVFNPSGAVIARYRKIHIFGKEGAPFSTPEKHELSEFKVDDVKFGTFICFDILYREPALTLSQKGVTHFAFTTAWFSELPFLTAIQEQSAWATSTNRVLLAAGYNDPEMGSTGSGIYYGKRFAPVSFQTQTKLNYAIVAKVPKHLDSYRGRFDKKIVYFTSKKNQLNSVLNLKTENLEKYDIEEIKETNFTTKPASSNLTISSFTTLDKTICQGGLCCTFKGKMTSVYVFDLVYRANYLQQGSSGDEFGMNQYNFAVFNGVRQFDDVASAGEQVCSILSCTGTSANSCGNRTDQNAPHTYQQSNYPYIKIGTIFSDLKITANFSTNHTFTTSQILLSSRNVAHNKLDLKLYGINADPSTYEVTQDRSKTFHLTTRKHKVLTNPVSINLYTRLFFLDGPPPSSASSITCSTFAILVSLITAWFFTR